MQHIIYDENNCTGCGACVAVCPVNAIEYMQDERGFYYPQIKENICIECGKCKKSCQLQKAESKNNIINAYALQIKDKKILQSSTSGGAFSAIAIKIFELQGIVYGCILDQNNKAVYARADNADEIKKMYGSKYVWANASKCFNDIKSELKNKKNVLFVGLPCQVDGLKLFLGKEYTNLLTVDFLCGGAPSQLAFNTYIQTLVKKAFEKDLDFKFRDKAHHGTGYCISYVKNGKKKYVLPEFSSYYYLFSNKYIQRDACFKCRYRGVHRVADITIGDYWGVDKVFPEFDAKDGVSIAISNTPTGDKLLDSLKPYCIMKQTTINDIAKNNIIRPDNTIKNISIPPQRNMFFIDLKKYGWNIACLKYTFTIKRLKNIIVHFLKKGK